MDDSALSDVEGDLSDASAFEVMVRARVGRRGSVAEVSYHLVREEPEAEI